MGVGALISSDAAGQRILGTSESLAALTALASDANAEVRFSAVFELGSWWQASHDPRIEAVLRNALGTGDPCVVRAARDALGESGEQ